MDAPQRPVTRARAAQIAQGIDLSTDTPTPPSPNVSTRRRPHPRMLPVNARRTSNPTRQPSPPIPDLPPLPSGDWDSDGQNSSDEEGGEVGPNGEKMNGDDLAQADPAEVRRRAQEMLEPYLPRDQPDEDQLFGAIASRQIPLDANALARLHESLMERVKSVDEQAWLHGPVPHAFGKPSALYRPHPSVALLDGSLLPQAAYQDDADSAYNPAAVTASFAELGLDPRSSMFSANEGSYGLSGLGTARGYLTGAMGNSGMDVDESVQIRARMDAAAGLRNDAEIDSSMLIRSFSTSTSTTTADHRSLLKEFPRLDMAAF